MNFLKIRSYRSLFLRSVKLTRAALEGKKREVIGDWIKNGKIAKGHI